MANYSVCCKSSGRFQLFNISAWLLNPLIYRHKVIIHSLYREPGVIGSPAGSPGESVHN